jgi:hypothetical protein
LHHSWNVYFSWTGSAQPRARCNPGIPAPRGCAAREDRRFPSAGYFKNIAVLRNAYFGGGVLVSAGGGVAVPLLDESGGGVADGLV